MWARVCSRGCSLTLTRAPLPQEFVPKEERGLVNGFQQAIQSLFTMGVFLLGMIDHRCESEWRGCLVVTRLSPVSTLQAVQVWVAYLRVYLHGVLGRDLLHRVCLLVSWYCRREATIAG